MEIMPNIDDASLRELRIEEVEEKREASQLFIEHLTKVNKEVLNDYLMKPIKLITLAKNFIKKTEKNLNLEVTIKICDGELDLEKMHFTMEILHRLNGNTKDFMIA
jgi:hypothetical protein